MFQVISVGGLGVPVTCRGFGVPKANWKATSYGQESTLENGVVKPFSLVGLESVDRMMGGAITQGAGEWYRRRDSRGGEKRKGRFGVEMVSPFEKCLSGCRFGYRSTNEYAPEKQN